MKKRSGWDIRKIKYIFVFFLGIALLLGGLHFKYNHNVDEDKLDKLRSRIIKTFEERLNVMRGHNRNDLKCTERDVCESLIRNMQGMLDKFRNAPKDTYYIVVRQKLKTNTYSELYASKNQHTKIVLDTNKLHDHYSKKGGSK